MRKFFRILAGFSAVAIVTSMGATAYYADALSDSYVVQNGQSLKLDQPGVAIKTVESEEVPVSSTGISSQTVELSLFGTIPIKEANLTEIDRTMLVPCGTPFGIKILTEGVMVVGLNGIDTAQGIQNPAKAAGIQVGDVIHEINETPVASNNDIASIVSESQGQALSVSLTREGEKQTVSVTPVLSTVDSNYKAGIWVRDSSAGIGTITYCDSEGKAFGGLGHPVCDVDTGMVLPLASGEIVSANISGAKKGEVGSPGELIGSFTTDKAIGTLKSNTDSGVFGTLNQTLSNHEAMPIGFKQEVHTGPATIFTTIQGGQPQEYDVEITNVDTKDSSSYKNMVVKITDPELLEKTGGIVQGMSGSPITQDGHLIGAVTHVFVNDPTQGYGIFIENMLEASQ